MLIPLMKFYMRIRFTDNLLKSNLTIVVPLQSPGTVKDVAECEEQNPEEEQCEE